MQLYDSHCHPNLDNLADQLTDILSTARANKMRFNVVGVDLQSSKRAVEIAAANKDVCRACVAIHPNDVQLFNYDEAKVTLTQLVAQNPNVVTGIGECGLDFHYSKKYVDLQYQFLEMQAQLAEQFQLPLMLHIRDAHDEAVTWLKKRQLTVPVVFHCFSETPEVANTILTELANQEVYLSIPGIVTFQNAKGLQAAVKLIPLSKMLVETDAPWLTPMPYRGKQNKPIYVQHTVSAIAQLINEDPEVVATATFKNATKLFWRT